MMTTLWSALSAGALYGLIGLLLTICLVRCSIFNFAQPFYVILGCYITTTLQAHDWNTFAVILVLAAIGAVLGGVQELTTIRPTRGSQESALVTSIGAAFALQGFAIAVWGPNALTTTFFGGSETLHVLGGVLSPVDLWLMGLLIVAAAGFQYAVSRTRWGVVGQAAMADPDAAVLRGINVPRLRTSAFVLAGALSVALGVFVAPAIGVSTAPALQLAVYGFAAAAIGGFGSFVGTAIGGVVVGVIQAFAARYLNVDVVPLIVFAALCAVLIVRPTGLLGRREGRLI